MNRLLLTTVLFLLPSVNFGQQSITSITKDFFTSSSKGSIPSSQIKQLEKFSLPDIIESCNVQLSDSGANIRGLAYQLIYFMALRKEEDPDIAKALNVLITGCKDSDGGVAFSNLQYLSYFKSTVFDIEAKVKLGQMAREGGVLHYPLLIKLTGLAGITDLMYDYAQMLQQKRYKDNNTRWALCLAMARLGDNEQANFCLNKIKQTPVSDNVVYDLLPDITYIRTNEAFDYLLEIINSNDKNCSSSNPDSEVKIICASRVIKMVAPYIIDFPVKVDKGGDIIATDYNKMLIAVREWISSNKTTYKLNTQIF